MDNVIATLEACWVLLDKVHRDSYDDRVLFTMGAIDACIRKLGDMGHDVKFQGKRS